MTEETAKTIVRLARQMIIEPYEKCLARQMIIEPYEKFEYEEFIESVKLFNDIVSTLIESDQDDQ